MQPLPLSKRPLDIAFIIFFCINLFFITYIVDHALAAQGLDLILIARRREPLAEITRDLTQKFGTSITPLTIDLAATDATDQIMTAFDDVSTTITIRII